MEPTELSDAELLAYHQLYAEYVAEIEAEMEKRNMLVPLYDQQRGKL